MNWQIKNYTKIRPCDVFIPLRICIIYVDYYFDTALQTDKNPSVWCKRATFKYNNNFIWMFERFNSAFRFSSKLLTIKNYLNGQSHLSVCLVYIQTITWIKKETIFKSRIFTEISRKILKNWSFFQCVFKAD